MENQSYESLRVWVWRLSAAAAFLVGILSFSRGVGFFWIMLRILLTFVILYGLSEGSIFLFEQGGAECSPEEAKGKLVDFVVGAEIAAADSEKENILIRTAGSGPDGRTAGTGVSVSKVQGFPGQVEPGLAQGLPDTEQQAKIVRRMGWND